MTKSNIPTHGGALYIKCIVCGRVLREGDFYVKNNRERSMKPERRKKDYTPRVRHFETNFGVHHKCKECFNKKLNATLNLSREEKLFVYCLECKKIQSVRWFEYDEDVLLFKQPCLIHSGRIYRLEDDDEKKLKYIVSKLLKISDRNKFARMSNIQKQKLLKSIRRSSVDDMFSKGDFEKHTQKLYNLEKKKTIQKLNINISIKKLKNGTEYYSVQMAFTGE